MRVSTPMSCYELVVFDMDGVLVDMRSSWRYMHTCFDTDNHDILLAYLQGEIGSKEFTNHDIALWRQAGKSLGDIEKYFQQVALMPGAQTCIRALSEHNITTAIVSGGLDILADRIAVETGIQHVLANGIKGDLEGCVLRVLIENKGQALQKLIDDLEVPREKVVAVGNSHYDISMFAVSGLNIAFNPCDNEVVAAADVVITKKDLSQILDYVLV